MSVDVMGYISVSARANISPAARIKDRARVYIGDNVVIEDGVLISQGVHLGNNVVIKSYSILEENVEVCNNTIIGYHVVVHADTRIGLGGKIGDHTVLGKLPQKAARSATTQERDLQRLVLGDDCVVGVHSVLYRGTTLDNTVFVADLVSIREDVTVGAETIVGVGVFVENKCSIGKRCKLEAGAYITAYSTIGDDCFIAPGVVTTNDNYLGRDPERKKHFKGITMRPGARLGGGAITKPGIVIAEDGVVGLGGVATKDIPQRVIVIGVPAEKFREVPERQLLENQPDYPGEKRK